MIFERAANPRALVTWGLVIALACSVLVFPLRVRGYLLPVLPAALLAHDPTAQARTVHSAFPYDILRDTDRVLSANARVLLVTDGREVRRREYITFHRALYYLVPRVAYWMSPAPPDGTWEARWWISAPLTQQSILQLAREKDAGYVLLLANLNWRDGNVVAQWSQGKLLALAPSLIAQPGTPRREFADSDWWWQLALAMLSILSIGVLLVAVVEKLGLRVARVGSLALAWVLGAGATAFGLVSLNALGLALSVQVRCITLLAFMSAVWALRHVRRFRRVPLAFRPSLQSSALLAWLGVQTCFVAIVALGQPLVSWDSWVTWGMKARATFIGQGIGAPVFADSSRAITHLDYPLLLPSLEAWVYQWLGAPDDRFAGWIAVAYYLALLGLTYGAARRLGVDAPRALLATAVVGSMPTLTLLAGQVIADIPFAVYALLTACALLEWIRHGERGSFLIALCGAACLPWTKREGLIFVLALGAAALLVAHRERRAWSGALACALTAAFVAGGWSVFLAAQGTGNTDFLPLTFDTLISNVNRLPEIALYFAKSLASYEWSFVWVLVALAATLHVLARRAVLGDMLLLAPLLYLGAMATGYLFSAFVPFESHLLSSGYRLVAQVTPLSVLWLASQTVGGVPRTANSQAHVGAGS